MVLDKPAPDMGTLQQSVEQGLRLGNQGPAIFFLEVSCSYYPCEGRTELVQSC